MIHALALFPFAPTRSFQVPMGVHGLWDVRTQKLSVTYTDSQISDIGPATSSPTPLPLPSRRRRRV